MRVEARHALLTALPTPAKHVLIDITGLDERAVLHGGGSALAFRRTRHGGNQAEQAEKHPPCRRPASWGGGRLKPNALVEGNTGFGGHKGIAVVPTHGRNPSGQDGAHGLGKQPQQRDRRAGGKREGGDTHED